MLRFQKNILLSEHTTMKVGGVADFFVEVKTEEDLKLALKFAEDNKLKFFVLGGGSNTFFSDAGFSGLVIKINIKKIETSEGGRNIHAYAGAGEKWDDIVALAVGRGWRGVENLSLIPGTVGGAVYQNIGAYGAELKDSIGYVSVLDTENGRKIKIKSTKCEFGYRTSLFQKVNNFIILGAEFKFSKNKPFNLSYPDLGKYFEDKKPGVKEIRRAIIKIRKSKIPYPDDRIGTAGSFFKNPVIPRSVYKSILKKYPALKGRQTDDGVKLSAGQLIEFAGWKGKKIGNVGVSEKHALVIVSYPGSKSKDIEKIVEEIKKSVKVNFGINLEEEVKMVQG